MRVMVKELKKEQSGHLRYQLCSIERFAGNSVDELWERRKSIISRCGLPHAAASHPP